MGRFFLLSLVLFVVCGCSDDDSASPEQHRVEYLISVDHIEVPESIGPYDSLAVKLFGYIGADGGYWFDHMETVETDSSFEMTAYGIHDENPELSWPQALIHWRGRVFFKSPPHSNVVRVVFRQPDDSVVEELVPVVH